MSVLPPFRIGTSRVAPTGCHLFSSPASVPHVCLVFGREPGRNLAPRNRPPQEIFPAWGQAPALLAQENFVWLPVLR